MHNWSQMVKMRDRFVHPDFNASAIHRGGDIALLQLDEPTNKTPIPLAPKKFVPRPGKVLTSLGWGLSSINLQQVNLKVNETDQCLRAWKGHLEDAEGLSTRVVCAWNSSADTCRGM